MLCKAYLNKAVTKKKKSELREETGPHLVPFKYSAQALNTTQCYLPKHK